jgi:hypothetical protein
VSGGFFVPKGRIPKAEMCPFLSARAVRRKRVVSRVRVRGEEWCGPDSATAAEATCAPALQI